LSAGFSRVFHGFGAATGHWHTNNEGRSTIMSAAPTGTSINWVAIDNDPRFQRLHTKKVAFLTGLMVFSLIYYFLLPIGAAYFTDLFKIKVYGVVNVGILFALSQFVVAWGIAFYYTARAKEFDAMAAELVREADKIGRK
jgi:uncharacterized membrane protein (DUF485 family)